MTKTSKLCGKIRCHMTEITGVGSIINRVENATGKSINSLIDEAMAVGSLTQYIKKLCKEYFPNRPIDKMSKRIYNSFWHYIRCKHGPGYYKSHFVSTTEIYRKISEHIGVNVKDMFVHIKENNININALCKIAYPQDPRRAYKIIKIRVARARRKNEHKKSDDCIHSDTIAGP